MHRRSHPEGLQAGFKPNPEMAYTGNPVLRDEQVGMVAALALGRDGAGEEFFLNAVRRTDGIARQLMIEAAVRGCRKVGTFETSLFLTFDHKDNRDDDIPTGSFT